MNARNFKKIVKARQRHTDETLLVKGEEYSRQNNRLHNFYRAAAINDQTPEQALWGMMSKHLVSLKDMIDDTAQGDCPSEDQIDEKLGDTINYLHLLDGLFMERLSMLP